MKNSNIIKIGLMIFTLFVMLPETVKPYELPSGYCVLPAKRMQTEHMLLLNVWHDDEVRGERSTIVIDGKEYRKSLQMACMECHTRKKNFCDECHIAASVTMSCWDCHLAPVED